MIAINFDLSEFQRAARQMAAAQDQVPFALSLALNESAKVARFHEIDTVWPRSITQRNKSFLRAALLTEWSTKKNLKVTVYDRLGRAHLKLHDKGGMKRARGRLAIPSSKVRRTSRGVSSTQRPSVLANAFLKGDSIFQRLRNGRLALMYTLRPSAQMRADVPFSAEFARIMRQEMSRRFGPAMKRAMRTRR